MKPILILLSVFAVASLRSPLRGSLRFAVLAVSLCSALQSSFSASPKPNIILIMADDFGYECVTANGGQSYQTPNLDRLAAAGIRFEQCHVQPLCTPTRVQLMTGRYNVRNYLKFGTLPRSETTFAHLLKKAGYTTAICGKWQLGHEVDAPQHFGFDEALLWQHTRRPPRYANAGLELNGVEKQFPKGSYGPTEINNFALDFISRQCQTQRDHPPKATQSKVSEVSSNDSPFFLYYPMILTHDPFQPTPDSPDWDPATKTETKPKSVKNFADMVAYMDKMIGRVDSKLEELGIRDNTLLFFLGDNGTHSSVTSQFNGRDFQGGKGKTTQRGHHVPLIVSWPGQIKQGRVTSDLISSADFLPTICEAAGISIPNVVDGISFLPQLRGERGSPRKHLYVWYSPRQRLDLTVREFVFDHRFKLYRTGQFYDRIADPDETNPLDPTDLTEAPSAAAKNLQAVLDQFKNARPIELDHQFQQFMKGTRVPQK